MPNISPNRHNRFVPFISAVCIIIGIGIGTFLTHLFYGNHLNVINASSTKLSDLLHIINDQYVDTVNIANVVDDAIPLILSELDPHSSYVTAKDADTANEDLRSSFSGIGVMFTISNDTVCVSNIVHGGPSERQGIMPGDRIVTINGKPFVGDIVTNEETMHRLKGPQGTKVRLGILRHGQPKTFTITREDIAQATIDAAYIIDDTDLGYVRIHSFGESTYPELLNALAQFQSEGFGGLVIDLRGNGGGYLAAAIQIANEFLPADRLIVYTQGHRLEREDYRSQGNGSYTSMPLIILTDEYTASSSEIVSGAIQDNDRGIIVGRRTFGKGLVQQPIKFSDGSLINLTVARYYTPSGRCIQKPYTKGQPIEYELDLLARYNHGEFFNEDSVRQTGEKYHTSLGRTVYGGGGIMPDYFVPEDTTHMTTYYSDVVKSGIITEYCFEYVDNNREQLSKFTTPEDLVRHLKKQRAVEKLVRYADEKGLVRRNNLIIKSRPLFEESVYGTMIYYLYDMAAYLRYINKNDITVQRAVELYKQKQTKPQRPTRGSATTARR